MKLSNQEILADILLNARIEKGYSQRKLASLASISNVEISKLEKGERQKPNPEFLMRISQVLDLDYEELLEAIGYIDNSPFDNNTYMLTSDDKHFILESLKERISDKKNIDSISKYLFNIKEESDIKDISEKVYKPVKYICDNSDEKQLKKFISLCNWFIGNELNAEK